MSTETTEPTEPGTIAQPAQLEPTLADGLPAPLPDAAVEAFAEAVQRHHDAQAAQTIDPNYSGPIEPGTIADQAAYDAAVASGQLIELSPEDVAALDVSHHLELKAAKDRAEAAEAALDKLRAAYEKTAEDLRALVLAREAPVVHESVQGDTVFADRGRLIPINGFAEPQARKRKRPFNLDLDKRQDRPESFLRDAIGTLGMPTIWARALRAAAPAAGVAARELIQAFGEDSPGGKRITRDELEDIAHEAAERLKRELIEEFVRG